MHLFMDKGNLAKSPKGEWIKRKDGSGDFFVATMRVFFGRYRQNDEGEIKEVGGFWREVELYGKKGEDAAKHLRKGARVLVVGEEQEYTGTDDNQNKVQVVKIVAEDVALILTRIESIKFAAPRNQDSQPNTDEEEGEAETMAS
ncbi:MAG: single-stranded DNA-binding protein [Burkholderiaceae bacterium]|jgi:single-strand DNA-binding protein|nr:single-stranded DNA-binding protein [Burkholderiaceae bacterium]